MGGCHEDKRWRYRLGLDVGRAGDVYGPRSCLVLWRHGAGKKSSRDVDAELLCSRDSHCLVGNSWLFSGLWPGRLHRKF